MFRRVFYESNIEEELLKKIKKYVPIIKGNSKKIGQDERNGEMLKFTSDEYLYYLIKEKGDIPVNEVSNKFSFRNMTVTSDLIPILQDHYLDYNIEESGHFYYYKTGFMSWHTNSDFPCTRIYITYADENKKSFFKYYKDGEVITDYDNEGLNIREFDITGKPPLLWHSIGSMCNRFSFGFRVT